MKTIIITDQEEKVIKELLKLAIETHSEHSKRRQMMNRMTDELRRLMPDEMVVGSTKFEMADLFNRRDEEHARLEAEYQAVLSLSGKLAIATDSTN